MQNHLKKKIEGGKMISMHWTVEKNKITEIKISGDFFLYPEEILEQIEKELIESELNLEIITTKIQKIIKNNNGEFFGISAKDIATLLTQKNEMENN